MYWAQTWIDTRLAFSSSIYDELSVSNELLNNIWCPDMFFTNAKHTKFNDLTNRNALIKIKQSGEVHLSLRSGQSHPHDIP